MNMLNLVGTLIARLMTKSFDSFNFSASPKWMEKKRCRRWQLPTSLFQETPSFH